MTSLRARFTRTIILFSSLSILLFSGCATATKLPTPATVEHPAAAVSDAAVAAPAEPKVRPPTPVPPAQIAAAVPTSEPTITPPPQVTRRATLKGSQAGSILLDNYTAFVYSIDGKKNAAGREGWETPLLIEAGRRVLEVEFNRGVFMARTTLELDAKSNAHYEIKYTTDAELFGHNSYCDFWIIDLASGHAVTSVSKTSVKKITASPAR